MATQSESFAKTVKFCQISMVELSEKSGVSRSYLTEFKKGKANPTVEIVEKLLGVMEETKQGSRSFFYLTCAGGTVTLSDRINQLSIDSPADRKEAADALRQIVSKFIPEDGSEKKASSNEGSEVKTRKNTDELAEVR